MIAMLIDLLAQQDNPLTGVPAPSEAIESAWPVIRALVPYLIAAAASGFAYWVKFREKRVDARIKSDQEKIQMQIEEMKMQQENRKAINEQFKSQIDLINEDARLIRAELIETRKIIFERDTEIAKLRGQEQAMRSQIEILKEKLNRDSKS